jgi:hypothetical protein
MSRRRSAVACRVRAAVERFVIKPNVGPAATDARAPATERNDHEPCALRIGARAVQPRCTGRSAGAEQCACQRPGFAIAATQTEKTQNSNDSKRMASEVRRVTSIRSNPATAAAGSPPIASPGGAAATPTAHLQASAEADQMRPRGGLPKGNAPGATAGGDESSASGGLEQMMMRQFRSMMGQQQKADAARKSERDDAAAEEAADDPDA